MTDGSPKLLFAFRNDDEMLITGRSSLLLQENRPAGSSAKMHLTGGAEHLHTIQVNVV